MIWCLGFFLELRDVDKHGAGALLDHGLVKPVNEHGERHDRRHSTVLTHAPSQMCEYCPIPGLAVAHDAIDCYVEMLRAKWPSS